MSRRPSKVVYEVRELMRASSKPGGATASSAGRRSSIASASPERRQSLGVANRGTQSMSVAPLNLSSDFVEATASIDVGSMRPTRRSLIGDRAGVPPRSGGARPSKERPPKVTTEQIVGIFKKFDLNNDGTISRDELEQVMKTINASLKDEDVQLVMDHIDKTGDGKIDYAEFASWLRRDDPEDVASPVRRLKRMSLELSPLDRARAELEQTKKAALPPLSKEVELDNSDLWMFPEGVTESANIVRKIVPTSRSYKAGVRAGWLLVQIDTLLVTDRTDVHAVLARSMGGGGGAKRAVTVRFVAKEALAIQKAAEESLPRLTELVENLEAEERQQAIEREAGAQKEHLAEAAAAHVTLQYYAYKISFTLVNGALAISAVNEAFMLSNAMPGCLIYLAKQLIGDTHLVNHADIEREKASLLPMEGRRKLTFTSAPLGIDSSWSSGLVTVVYGDSQAERLGVKEGWVIEKVDGSPYTPQLLDARKCGDRDYTLEFKETGAFFGLVAGQTYFVLVDQGEKVSEQEREWRERMQKQREAERLAALAPHDCRKEQVPSGLTITASQGDFIIEIDRTEGRSLGLNLEPDDGNTSLKVMEVNWWGLAKHWNTCRPRKQIKYGDYIVEVNGVSGKSHLLEKELEKLAFLKIQIRRCDYNVGDHVQARFKNAWTAADIVEVRGEGMYALQYVDGFKEDYVKGPFDLKKDEAQEKTLINIRGDYTLKCSRNGRALYENKAGAFVYFQSDWRINLSEDSVDHCYHCFGETGLVPPRHGWESPYNPGKTATITYRHGMVCRVCAPGALI